MNKTDEALAALENRDWSNAEPVGEKRRKASFVHSTRLSAEMTDRLFAEAHRRGITPSELIRELVEAGLADVEDSVTVRLADVRRMIDRLPRAA